MKKLNHSHNLFKNKCLFVLFRFPLKNPERNQLWIDAVRRKGFIPTKNSFICSAHFLRSDYNFKPGGSYRLYLNETAVPSIIPDPNIEKKIPHISIVNIGGENIFEKTTQSPGIQNTPELECSNSQIQETSFEVLSEIPDSPNEENKLKAKDTLLITPSKFKINKRLFSPTVKRKIGATIDSPKTGKLKKKIKLLQQGIRRKDQKIKNLVDLLKSMNSKGLIDNQTEELLSDKFEGTSKALFSNELLNKGRKATGCRYSKAIKEFAITLNYYSPKALKYCR